MPISFDKIKPGTCCTRPLLADIWGFSGYQALAKGIITPKGDNKIILFVTCPRPAELPRYAAEFKAGILHWEGPRDHYAEDRLLHSTETGDEIHVFYRERYRWDFTYEGRFTLQASTINTGKPSLFTLKRF